MLQDFERYWHGEAGEVRLLLDRRDPDAPRRLSRSAAGSLGVHLLFAGVLALAPDPPPRPAAAPQVLVDLKRATPLVAPRLEEFRLTQKEPAASKPASEVDIASLLPKPDVRSEAARPAPGTLAPGTPAFRPPETPRKQARMVEAPSVDLELGQLLPDSPAPRIQAQEPRPAEPPKLAFERLGGPNPGPVAQAGTPALRPPATSVEEAIRQAAREGPGRGLIVGDGGSGTGGYSDPLNQQGRPGQNFGTLELLSDPQGVDFRPYLIQVLAAVRRNWLAVIPESARLGQRRGRVAVQFAIHQSGRVPKLVIAMPSGVEALDRAAVAGVSASNPFPPLPSEFKGSEIRLQLVFSYNMPR